MELSVKDVIQLKMKNKLNYKMKIINYEKHDNERWLIFFNKYVFTWGFGKLGCGGIFRT